MRGMTQQVGHMEKPQSQSGSRSRTRGGTWRPFIVFLRGRQSSGSSLELLRLRNVMLVNFGLSEGP